MRKRTFAQRISFFAPDSNVDWSAGVNSVLFTRLPIREVIFGVLCQIFAVLLVLWWRDSVITVSDAALSCLNLITDEIKS